MAATIQHPALANPTLRAAALAYIISCEKLWLMPTGNLDVQTSKGSSGINALHTLSDKSKVLTNAPV